MDSMYQDLMAKKSALAPQQSMAPAMAEDIIPADAGAQALKAPGMTTAADTQAASSMENAGSIATGAGMASANPYLAGAGLTLQALGMVDNAKRAQEQAKIDAYNNKIMQMRAASRNLFA